MRFVMEFQPYATLLKFHEVPRADASSMDAWRAGTWPKSDIDGTAR